MKIFEGLDNLNRPANECWFDVPHESKNEWEWAFWKTIKLKAKHV